MSLAPSPFRYTLLGDGASDRSLLPILDWALGAIAGFAARSTVSQVADLRGLSPAARSLEDRVRQATRSFPCELLFIHRDSEGQSVEWRIREIRAAAEAASITTYVPVVPVQMTEAWLLIDEDAIRRAAGNPHGQARLTLPPLARLEEVADPKSRLHEHLCAASEKTGRRLDQFQRRISDRVQRVAGLIDDFSPLLSLPAFARFDASLRSAVASLV